MASQYYYRYRVVGDHICLQKYRVNRHTEKGVWLEMGYKNEKFVLDGARKKYANPTIEGARHNFIKRREKYVQILASKLHDANQLLDFINGSDGNIPNTTAKAVRWKPYSVEIDFTM